jgi:hypothetical protein
MCGVITHLRDTSFVPMSAEIFEARWNRIRELRDEGHIELEEFLGGTSELGAALRCGLLMWTAPCCEWQRYQGLVPTVTGEHYLLHVPEHHLIVVHRDKQAALHGALLLDPAPGQPLVIDAGALPCGLQPAPPANPKKRTDFDPVLELQRLRAEELQCWILEGYADFEAFLAENTLSHAQALSSGLVRRNDPRQDAHRIPLVPQAKGEHYLLLIAAWDLLLVKPEMMRNVFTLIDPDRARGWMAA